MPKQRQQSVMLRQQKLMTRYLSFTNWMIILFSNTGKYKKYRKYNGLNMHSKNIFQIYETHRFDLFDKNNGNTGVCGQVKITLSTLVDSKIYFQSVRRKAKLRQGVTIGNINARYIRRPYFNNSGRDRRS